MAAYQYIKSPWVFTSLLPKCLTNSGVLTFFLKCISFERFPKYPRLKLCRKTVCFSLVCVSKAREAP